MCEETSREAQCNYSNADEEKRRWWWCMCVQHDEGDNRAKGVGGGVRQGGGANV